MCWKVVRMVERKRTRLSAAEKNDIGGRWKAGQSMHAIGRAYGRPHPTIRKLLLPRGGIAGGLSGAASTVSRDRVRQGGRLAYRAHDADAQAGQSALRPKSGLLAMNRKLRDIVASKRILDWSPEQISGWLKNRHPHDESMRVSPETIYRSLFVQARGVLKKELMDHLRSKRRMRRWRHFDQVELRLNQRPRKTLGFQTPASKLQASVASTV